MGSLIYNLCVALRIPRALGLAADTVPKPVLTMSVTGGDTLSPALLSLVNSFLNQHGFESTSKAFAKELKKKGLSSEADSHAEGPKTTLEQLYSGWNTKPSSASGSKSSSISSSSSSSSSSEASDDEATS